MVEEIIMIAGSTVAGAVSAAVIDRMASAKASSKNITEEKLALKMRTPALVKAEISSLDFEKSLVSEGITRVYEAFQQGKIDRLERDRLLIKYKQQLDSLNQRIASVKPLSDFSELLSTRNTLATLLEQRISSLDRRLAEIAAKSGIEYSEELKNQAISNSTGGNGNSAKTDVETRKEREESKKAAQEPGVEEKKIDQLQKEIMQALVRLEQVEIDDKG
jgi:hypothetical protein